MLYVQPVAEAGGSDRALLQMVRSVRGTVNVHIALPGASPLDADYIAAGATLHHIGMRRITRSGGVAWWLGYAAMWPIAVLRLAMLARRVRADIVHTNSLHSWYGWAASLLCNRPHVWHAREIVFQSGLALRAERALIGSFATLVPAISAAVASQLPQAPTRLIYDDIDRDRFAPSNAGRFRTAVGVGDGEPLAGVVCRIDTWKGVELALDAFDVVRTRLPAARLVIVGAAVAGKEAYAAALAARASTMPGVMWLGERSDVPDVVADLDVLVAAATEPEPWGLSIAEALASGCPVIISDHGGAPEILAMAAITGATRGNGAAAAGVAVAPGELGALIEAMTAALRSGRIAGSADLRAARRPLTDPHPPAWRDLYDEVLGMGRVAPWPRWRRPRPVPRDGLRACRGASRR